LVIEKPSAENIPDFGRERKMSRGLRMPDDEPEEEQQPKTVRHLAGLGGMSVEEFLDDATGKYPFYGLLLPSPGESSVNAFVRSHWDQIHAMTGKSWLLVTALAPDRTSEATQKFLTGLVGEDKAQRAMQGYHQTPEEMEANAYKLAQETRIEYGKLPCLVLMSDLSSNQRIIQRLPNWDAEALRHLYEALSTVLTRHTGEPSAQKRFEGIKADLGWTFMAKLHAAHVAGRIGGTLEKVEWSEVIQATLTNKEFMAGAMKIVLTVFGVAAA
jgi:hypothetical protein